jgi:ATP-dependent helicase/nuclease subunit B
MPDLRDATILLPSLAVAPAMARGLADAAGRRALLAPRLTTLARLAADTPLGLPLPRPGRRTCEIYGALRDRGWFPQHDLWAIADDVAALIDELTAHRVGLPASLGALRRMLEQAYASDANASIGFEARVVHELWRVFAAGDAGAPDAQTRHHLALDRAAGLLNGPLYCLALDRLSPVEHAFLDACAARVAVVVFDPLLDAGTADPVTRAHAAAWVADPGVAGGLAARAQRLRDGLAEHPLAGRVTLAPVNGVEQEAAVADAVVRGWLADGAGRVGVIALDRLVARRLRALLERGGVLVADESGWALSTTSAATVVARWLDCVASSYYHRDLLDLLKSPFILGDWAVGRRRHLAWDVERLVRAQGVVRSLDAFESAAARAGDSPDIREVIGRLRQAGDALGRGRRTLCDWLDRLGAALAILGVRDGLAGDAAGVQLLARLDALAFEVEGEGTRLAFPEWRRWFTRALEQAMFRDRTIESPVIFTSLVAARLRGFDAVVILGADAAHLPARGVSGPFFNDAVRGALGLPTTAARVAAETRDLMLLAASTPRVVWTWQSRRAGEDNAPSLYVERLATLNRIAFGDDLVDRSWPDQARRLAVAPPDAGGGTPVSAPPGPVLPGDLVPPRVSPSGYATLVACPYQFFARHALRLDEPDDVREAIEKQDFGIFVHQALHAFHAEHPVVTGVPDAALESTLRSVSGRAFADAIAQDYHARAWLKRWLAAIPHYLDFQRRREADGWRWSRGEAVAAREIALGGARTVTLRGRIDRIDRRSGAAGDVLALVDFKTRRRTDLQKEVKDMDADVQLACYALLAAEFGLPVVEALYLSLDASDFGAVPVEAADVASAAQRHLERIAHLFSALHAGAGLPANGTEAACAWCAMRGLCRRDYWETAP